MFEISRPDLFYLENPEQLLISITSTIKKRRHLIFVFSLFTLMKVYILNFKSLHNLASENVMTEDINFRRKKTFLENNEWFVIKKKFTEIKYNAIRFDLHSSILGEKIKKNKKTLS